MIFKEMNSGDIKTYYKEVYSIKNLIENSLIWSKNDNNGDYLQGLNEEGPASLYDNIEAYLEIIGEDILDGNGIDNIPLIINYYNEYYGANTIRLDVPKMLDYMGDHWTPKLLNKESYEDWYYLGTNKIVDLNEDDFLALTLLIITRWLEEDGVPYYLDGTDIILDKLELLYALLVHHGLNEYNYYYGQKGEFNLLEGYLTSIWRCGYNTYYDIKDEAINEYITGLLNMEED